MKNIVPKENCLTEVQLLRYLHDECNTDEVRAIDRHLTHCPMCSDALEGAMSLDTGHLGRSLKHIDAQIKTQFSDKTKVVTLEKPVLTVVKSQKRLWWLWVAASIALVATAGIALLTKPVESSIMSTELADTVREDSLGGEELAVTSQTMPEASVAAQNGISQANSFKNEEKAGFSDSKTSVTSAGDVSATEDNAVSATTTNAATNDVAVSRSMKSEENAVQMDAYGVAAPTIQAESKVAAARQQEIAAAETYKKAESSKAKQMRQQQMAAPSVNNYPGAAAQNVPSKAIPSTDDGLADYQIGMQYFTREEYSQAIAQLNRVLGKQSKGVVYESALWYLANSYLKLGKKQEGRVLLQRIVTEKGKYAPQAADLLK